MEENKSDYLKIKYKAYNIDIEIRNKVTLLQGLSASGKTKLVELINAINTLQNTDIIESSKTLIPINSNNIGPFANNYIYFLDEINSSTTLEFAKNIKLCNSKFVIINRDSLFNLNYGMEDIYNIVKEKGKIIAVKKYKNIENKNLFNYMSENLIEDSKSGYQFYRNILNNVKTTNGAANIINKIRNGSNIQNIILDEYSIGPYIEPITRLSSENNIGLVLQGSFEDLIVKSIFKVNKFEYDMKNSAGLEQSAELKCKELFKEIYKNYKKSNLNNWLLEELQKEKIINEIKKINIEFKEEIINKQNTELNWGIE